MAIRLRIPLSFPIGPLFAHAALAFAAAVSPTRVQAQTPADRVGGWYAWEGAWRSDSSRWGADVDVQLRGFELLHDFAQTSLRAALVHRPGSRGITLNAGAGIFVDGQFGPDRDYGVERRLHQTAAFTHHPGPWLRASHRLRAEQRWLEGGLFRTRYRYRLAGHLPLTDSGLEGDGVRLVVSDEIMVNGETRLDGGRRVRWLDQNRGFIAVNAPLANGSRIEVGYLNITRFARPLHRIRMTVKTRF